HHDRIRDPEHERLRRDSLVLDVEERPPGGDAAFRRREKEDLVADIRAFQLVPRLRYDSRPAVEVVARREALGGEDGFALDYRPRRAHYANRREGSAQLRFPVQAISTQSRVRRRIVLKRCAPMMFTI